LNGAEWNKIKTTRIIHGQSDKEHRKNEQKGKLEKKDDKNKGADFDKKKLLCELSEKSSQQSVVNKNETQTKTNVNSRKNQNMERVLKKHSHTGVNSEPKKTRNNVSKLDQTHSISEV
jgi:hypothetical protein